MQGKVTDLLVHLQAENAKLFNEVEYYRSLTSDFNSLKNEVASLKNLVSNLKDDKDKLNKEHAINIESIESKYQKEIIRLKNEIQLQSDKYDFYNKLSTYVKNLEINNEELSVTLKHLKEEHKNELKLEQDRNLMENDHVKRKTLNFLANVKKEASIQAYDNLNNHSKLTLLQMKQFKNELEVQSNMIEDLLDKVNNQESIIKTLKSDLVTQKELRLALTKHNKKLSDMVKNLIKDSKCYNKEHGRNLSYDKTFNNLDFKSNQINTNSKDMALCSNNTAKSFYKSVNLEDKSTRNPSLNTFYFNKLNPSSGKVVKVKTILDTYSHKLYNESNKMSFIKTTLI